MPGPAPRLFTIAPDVPFLRALARAILVGGFPSPDTPAPGPLDLPRWTIYLPTRRAARALTQAFLEEGGSTSRLLPRIRPLGDVDEEELAFAEPLPGAGGEDIPPAISPFERQFLLARLIADWAKANPLEDLAQTLDASPGMCLLMAKSLAKLLDNFEMEEISLDKLKDLAGPEYPMHREALIGFLAILRVQLPHELERLGLIGSGKRRSLAIRAEAERLLLAPPSGPVIAAGSTGSIPATAELLKVIARLPQGAVVLPGLDLHLDADSWETLGAKDNDKDQQQHPQWGLYHLLKHMGAVRGQVELLPGLARGPGGEAREFLLSELMRPSDKTDYWRDALKGKEALLAEAMQGIHLLPVPDTREEAAAIAFLMRRTLETPGRTAALVTPDRNLARRVKAELSRWRIELDDTAGEPLARAAQASLLRLLLEAAATPLDAQALVALTRHPLAGFGMDDQARQTGAAVIDLALRGVRAPNNLASLEAFLTASAVKAKADKRSHVALKRLSDADWQNAAELVRKIALSLESLPKAMAGESALQYLLTHHLRAAEEAASANALWHGDAGEALSLLFQNLTNAAASAPPLRGADYLALITGELAATPLRVRRVSHPRLAIYGLLEARLVNADVMILGGLNETVWPQEAETDPWLSRPMKKLMGLMLPERRIGLTAHDFVQGFSGEEIWLSSARKRHGTPAVPSRWLLRLKALLKAADLEALAKPDETILRQALGLDMPALPTLAPPQPKPAKRPTKFSVTQVQKLISDPYAFYAREILKLEPLKSVGAATSAADRGTLIHDAIDLFTKRHPGPLGENALEHLLACGEEKFGQAASDKELHGFWWPQFKRIAQWFIDEERKLRLDVATQIAETRGEASFILAGETYSLSARADRIDILKDGTARLLDYKTGQVPSGAAVTDGRAPQLPLEAWLLQNGGFKDAGTCIAAAFIYMKLSGTETVGEIKEPVKQLAGLADASFAGLRQLLEDYARKDQPYLPLPDETRFADYDHLARYAEWIAQVDADT
jgi:ATP-dependent helicase/nuclease subunit B